MTTYVLVENDGPTNRILRVHGQYDDPDAAAQAADRSGVEHWEVYTIEELVVWAARQVVEMRRDADAKEEPAKAPHVVEGSDRVMTPVEVRDRVRAIEAEAHDPERAHGMEDALYRDVLQYIATHPNAGIVAVWMARDALETRDIDFERWSA